MENETIDTNTKKHKIFDACKEFSITNEVEWTQGEARTGEIQGRRQDKQDIEFILTIGRSWKEIDSRRGQRKQRRENGKSISNNEWKQAGEGE